MEAAASRRGIRLALVSLTSDLSPLTRYTG